MTVLTNARNQRHTVLSRWRFAWATSFATSLAMCMVPAGCAASDEQAETPSQPWTSERKVSPGTVDAILACANEGVSRLSRNAYDIQFEVQATELGAVRRVEPNEDRLDDAELEACIIEALKAMSVRDLLPADESFAPTSHSILPHARSLIGNTAVLPQMIRLAPIVVTASGVTIVVAVVVVVAVVAAISVPTRRKPTKEECDEEKLLVIKQCNELLALKDPPLDVVGRSLTMKECIYNLLTEDCGGKPLDWGKQGRPGTRY